MGLFDFFYDAAKKSIDVANNSNKASTASKQSGSNTTKSTTSSKQSNLNTNFNNYYVPPVTNKNNNVNKSTNSYVSSNKTSYVNSNSTTESNIDIDALVDQKRQYSVLKQNLLNAIGYLNTSIKKLEKPAELIKSSYTINGTSADGGNFKVIRQVLIDKRNTLNTILDQIDKKIIDINEVIQ